MFAHERLSQGRQEKEIIVMNRGSVQYADWDIGISIYRVLMFVSVCCMKFKFMALLNYLDFDSELRALD